MSSGCWVDVEWMSSGCQVDSNSILLDFATLTWFSEFPSDYHWLNRNKVAASKIIHGKKNALNQGLWLVESLESRILIGREPLPKIFKGGTLTIENLCQLMNFGLILLDWGCHIFIGPSGCPVDFQCMSNGCQVESKDNHFTSTVDKHPLDIHLTSTWHPLDNHSTSTQHQLFIHFTSTQHPLDIHSTSTRHPLDIHWKSNGCQVDVNRVD